MNRQISTILKNKYIYLMLAPSFVTVFIFCYLPLFGWVIAFENYSAAKGMLRSNWVGLQNFKLFFVASQDYVYTITNTLVMNFGSLILGLIAPLIFAILLYELRSRVFSNVMQVASIFPFLISWGVTYSLINSFFASQSGAINQILVNYGVIEHGLNILGDPKYSWMLIILSATWKGLGYSSIIFLAAIAAVEREQFESAEIDGAGRFKKIWYIMLPNLIPTFVVILILNSGSVFNSDLGQYLMFTNATNWPKMEVLDMYIYNTGLKQGDFSYGTAVGIIMTIISLGMVFAVNYISKRLTDKSIL